jgi:hypothetical protein
MPNDAPDWVRVFMAQLVGRASSFTPLGDVTSPAESADSATETITYSPGVIGEIAAMASFKAAAGSVIARVGSVGPVTVGTASSVSPTFGQATTSGHLLVCVVGSGSVAPTTGQAGWSQVVVQTGTGGFVAIWIKPNCGNGETAPTFTAVGGTAMMIAQLVEFSGVATASPTDQSAVSAGAGTSVTVTNPAVDVAYGDLVILGTRWALNTGSGATFSQVFNNGGSPVHAGDTTQTLGGSTRAQSFTYSIIPAVVAAQPLGVAGWAYDAVGVSEPATGTNASVVLAASPGKAYTAAAIQLDSGSSTAAVQQPRGQLVDGSPVIWTCLPGTPAAAGNYTGRGGAGYAYKGTAGNSMTLRTAGIAAGGVTSCALGAYLR